MICLILRTGGLKTKVCPTISVRPRAAASSTSSHACAVSAVIGFSTNTCLPASRAALAMGWCVPIGVAMRTASTLSSPSTTSRSVVAATAGYRACAFFSASGRGSHTQTTCASGSSM